MPLITGRDRVLEVFAAAARRGWVLPAFNAENLTTMEAILAAAKEFGRGPIIVDITCQYSSRPQAKHYTHSRDWRTGLKLFLADLRTLTEPGAAYADVDVLVHLDHIQADEEVLTWDLRQFSSIMFDASALPIEENIRRTAAFVKQHGRELVIEGAADEIRESGDVAGELTSPELAERYHRTTGVDLLVANLGTEHRATAASLQYHGELAREITKRVGPRLCLHGTSSVPAAQVKKLFADGVRRVNLWTTLERDSTPVLLQAMQANADKLAGPKAQLSHYAQLWRQDIIFNEMKRIVRSYLDLWYV